MANITINLDGNAEEGLQALESELQTTTDAVDDLATSTAKASAAQQQQITVIHEQRAATSTMAVALTTLAGEGAKLLAVLAPIYERHRLLAAVQGTVATGATAITTAFASQTTRWKLLHDAGDLATQSILKRLTGLGPPILGATAALVGFEAIMDRTGKRSVGWAEDWSKATDEQIARYETLTDEANRLGKTVDEVAAAHGIANIELELGIQRYEKFETNLDRIQTAAGGLRQDLVAIGSEAASNIRDAAMEFSGLNALLAAGAKAWDELDASATRSADQMVVNINLMRDWLIGTRELEEAAARMDAQREKERAGFDGLRAANAALVELERARQRAAEIASLETIEGIEAEIQAIRKRAAEMAQEGRSRAAVEKYVLDEITAVENQRARLIAEAEAQRKAADERSAAFRRQLDAQMVRAHQIAQEQMAKAAQDAHDQERKMLEDLAQQRRTLESDARTQQAADLEALLKARGEQRKAAAELLQDEDRVRALQAIERDTADAIHQLRIRHLRDETAAAIAAADSEESRRKAAFEGQRALQRAEADFQRQRRVQQLQDETAAAKRSVEIEKDKQAKLKALQQDALEKAGVKGEDLLQLGKKQDVSRILQDQARQKAAQKFQAENSDAWRKAQFDSNDRRQFQRQMERAQEQAALQARKDFAGGKTDPQALAQAQAQAAQKQLGALAQTNKLSADSVQAMGQLIQATAEQQATTQALQRQVADMQRTAQQLNGQAQQSRRQAQAGSLR